MLGTARIVAAAAIAASLMAGWHWVSSHYYNQGAAAVQARWDEQREQDAAAAKQAALERANQERAKEKDWRAHIDKLTKDNHALQAQLDGSRRSARAAERVLHTTIASLRADLHAAGRAAGTAPATAASLERASAAADLLGQCAGRYTGVAADADRLALQVSGLQQYVEGVCK